MSETKARLNRRNFLLAVGVGSAASAAVLVAKTVPPAPSNAKVDDKKKTRGYQASDHIRNYYRTAKV